MIRSFFSNKAAAWARRVGAVAGLLALGFGQGAGAQSPVAAPPSPPAPTPYSWPVFHAGGEFTALPNGFSSTLTPSTSNVNPLFGQLQGTPTGFLFPAGTGAYTFQTDPTQIPSFVFGNYVPGLPPSANGVSGGVITLNPNHLRDGTIAQWQAPFAYTNPESSLTATQRPALTVDDDNVNNTAGQTFTPGGFTDVINEDSATFGSYRRVAATTNRANTVTTAKWMTQIPADPADTNNGNGAYIIAIHVPPTPLPPPDGTSPPYPERRVPDAHYTVTYTNINGVVKTFKAQATQDGSLFLQPLTGPIQPQVGTDIVVTLDNYTDPDNYDNNVLPANTFVVADSITIRPAQGVQDNLGDSINKAFSSPTAVNATEFPEIANAKYYGVLSPNAAIGPPPVLNYPTARYQQARFVDPIPHGNVVVNPDPLNTVTAIGLGGGPVDRNHIVRQVVYFGRSELRLERTADVKRTVAAGDPEYTGNVIGVGAIYCVDGLTGGVIWRYETPPVRNPAKPDGPLLVGSGGVFSSPVVTRINVLIGQSGIGPNGTTVPAYATKLVVIVGDEAGHVYCLDAVGNRDGSSNSDSLDLVNNQPIYNVDALPAADTFPGHVGTTRAFWVYRPHPNKPKYVDPVPTGKTVGDVKVLNDFDNTRDLPVPGKFRFASPTVYVDPAQPINQTNDYPGAPGVASLTSNATVYVGNGNGVLYALDALGVPVTGTTVTDTDPTKNGLITGGDSFNASLDLRRNPAAYPPVSLADALLLRPEYVPAVQDIAVPTPTVKWWFTLRDPNGKSTETRIESAPAVLVVPGGKRTIFFGSSHELGAAVGATTTFGRLYAVDQDGPTGNGGTGTKTPGSLKYNVDQRPQWSFPDRYGNTPTGTTTPGKSSDGKTRPALGSISGSPVLYTTPGSTTTRIYFAANTGAEILQDDNGNAVDNAPTQASGSGRIWAVNTDGSFQWGYPDALDPNDASPNTGPDAKPQPSVPIGSFLHATPAVGFVQFPSIILQGDGTSYTHDDGAGDVKGRSVPMLYVGTSAENDSALYALDLAPNGTGAAAETQREIYRVVSDEGAAFQSSPALIANSSTSATPGNGGAVFATVGNTLYQFSATPITNIPVQGPPVQNFGLINIDAKFTGFGPISSPSVAAPNVLDLNGDPNDPNFDPFATNLFSQHNTLDFIYVGDSATGLYRGITSDETNGGVALGDFLPPGVLESQGIDPRFNLYTYLFDNSLAHPAGSRDMTTLGKGGYLTGNDPVTGKPYPIIVREWGQNLYLRFSNVVPPNPTDDPNLRVFGSSLDPATPGPDPTFYYTNGGQITYKIVDASTTDTTNPTELPNAQPVPPILYTTPPGPLKVPLRNGFYPRDPREPDPAPGEDPNGVLRTAPDATPLPSQRWIGAVTLRIRNITPGAQRRITEVQQTVTRVDANGLRTQVVLRSTATQGRQYSIRRIINGRRVYTFGQTAAGDQPTFAVLNPLAVRGGGVPLPVQPGVRKDAVPIGRDAYVGPNRDGLGPFRGLTTNDPSTQGLPAGTAGQDNLDLQSLTNGNTVYVKDAPPNGTGAGTTSPTDVRIGRNAFDQNYPRRARRVTMATGLINHNTAGDNTDPTFQNVNIGLLVGKNTGSRNNGLDFSNPTARAPYGNFTLNVADRSALGLTGQPLNIEIQSEALVWNDNSGADGPGAVVNILPFDNPPRRGGDNRSPDYPNMGADRITHTLKTRRPGGSGGDLNGRTRRALDPAEGDPTNPEQRSVFVDPLQVRIRVPKYQPADLQLFTNKQGRIPPTNPDGSDRLDRTDPTNHTFPMGYVSTLIIFSDVNGNRKFDRDVDAYREVNVYTGVPSDMSTSIAETTTDIGKVPHGFGILADQFPALIDAKGNAGFTPYNTAFSDYFKPLTVHNDGNVNLLNVHFDQKVNAGGGVFGLPMAAGPLDSLAVIPGFDVSGISGNRQYLIRTPLDTDLTASIAPGRNIGRNPGVAANNAANLRYLGATFHKNRVGTGNPSPLYVPDVPNDNDTTFASNPLTAPYSLVIVGPNAPLKQGTYNGVPAMLVDDPASIYNGKPAAKLPTVSVAVPLGTPGGTYSQRLRVFEGLDFRNPKNPNVNPLAPPTYAGQEVNVLNQTNPDPTAYYTQLDTLLLSQGLSQPNSDPATILKATVVESRLTDGSTIGEVPQIDRTALGTGSPATGVADFLPGVYRDIYWNNGVKGTGGMALVFTSNRSNVTPGTTAPYNVIGATLPFGTQTGLTTLPAFYPSDPVNRWWSAFGSGINGAVFTNTQGVNSAMSVTHDQPVYQTGGAFASGNSAYGFVHNVGLVPGTTGTYSNNIYCLPLDPATGAPLIQLPNVGAAAPAGMLVSSDPAQAKFGVRGLKFSNVPFADPAGGPQIQQNLWAFWFGGTRGRTALYYSSSVADGASGSGTPAPWQTNSVLPLPAGLVSVSDPSAILVAAPDPTQIGPNGNGAAIPMIQVTYSGVAAGGNADIYVSHYRPYHPQKRDGTPDNARIALGLVYGPTLTETLQPDAARQYWSARDVAWARNANLSVAVGGTALTPGNAAFDRATGTLVLTGVTYPVNGVPTPNQSVFVDLASGRLRFSRSPSGAGGGAIRIEATFNSGARRITTDSRADTAPTAFIDESFKANEANSGGAGSLPATYLGRVKTDRYWSLWRKAGANGTSTTPTLFYKTQRLTAVLDLNGSPFSIKLRDGTLQPIIAIKDAATGANLYTETGGSQVANGIDIDWARGRVYFPLTTGPGNGGVAMEGRQVSIAFTDATNTARTLTADVHWMDEARYNDIKALPGGGTNPTAFIGDTQVPIDTAVNENNVSAFLDPIAFGNLPSGSSATDQPHRVWLFWNSTRNGTADLYYLTLNPRFSAQGPTSP